MRRLVMKFGGSLVASKGGVRRVADLALRSRKRGDEVVVVVSALRGVTDLLLSAAAKAPKWSGSEVQGLVRDLRDTHRKAIGETTLDASTREDLNGEIEGMLGTLGQTLLGVSILGELSPRSKDMVVSYGERLSAPIVSAELRSRGTRSRSFSGGEAGIITDEAYGEASPLQPSTTRAVRRALLPELSRGGVPVVAGFIGRSSGGNVTTLGRGGSDYTATILGSALGADEVWIWTDVNGIMTADPRVVPNPARVAKLSYAEAEELAFFGAKNMHPLALAPARANHLPVRIKSGVKPETEETLITDQLTKAAGVIKVVAEVKNVGLLTVSGEALQGSPGIAARIFTALGEARVNILMISQSVSEANISMITRRGSLRHAEAALTHRLEHDGISAEVVSDPDIAVVAAVGAGMRGEKGVAARVFGAVASRGINVKMIAQGSSELNISFVVKEKDADEAVRALHRLVVPLRKGRQNG